MGDNSWTTVSHRNRNMHGYHRVHRTSYDPRKSHVNSDVISLFITNFLDFVQIGDIQRVCGRACNRLGHIVGVFIAKKLSKSGKRFGFIRFCRVLDCDSLIIQLREVWFGSYKLFASLPHSLANNSQTSQPIIFSTAVQSDDWVKSYANVVRGSLHDTKNSKNTGEIIELTPGDFIVEKKQTTCLIKARDFSTLPNLRVLCMDEGFDSFEIRYVGGLWVMIAFNSKTACKNFLSSITIDHWIAEKKPLDRNFVPSERLVWVDVEGLPLSAWSKDSFRKILSRWGIIAQLDDDLGEDIYKNRICILTSIKTIISEVIKVCVYKITYWIRVNEAPGWTPSFVHDFPSPELDNSDIQSSEHNNEHLQYAERNEEVSSDPFGIYDAIEKMKNKSKKEGLQGQYGNSTTENVHYHYTANCRASSSLVTSQVNSSTAPGTDATRPTVVDTAQVSHEVAAPVVNPQTTHDVFTNITVAPAVNSETNSVHSVHSGLQKMK
ncbi:unnamed protein product [Lactuca saligna]|uniref:DUF4283 domain-containing protein n=1 Tax=Lactuca saligna TaxID=75948 RepID=A0AA35V2S8_LACSI|nr:unnamed protein product [Lactuca saligna]